MGGFAVANLCFAYSEEGRAARWIAVLSQAGMQVRRAPLGGSLATGDELFVLQGPPRPVLEGLRRLGPARADAPLAVALFEGASGEDRVAALRLGAFDVLDEAASPEELCVRIDKALESRRRFRWLLEENHRLDQLSSTDPLTELPNRRHFQERLVQEYRRAQRYEAPLALVLLDLDNFKQVNDRFGHPAGDAVLKAVAQCLRRSVRDTDLSARVGGEEFAVVLPQTHLAGSLTVAERIRRDLSQMTIGDSAIQVTVSCGVAGIPGLPIAGPEDLFRSADEALYRAKREGRNRICLYSVARPLSVPAGLA